jgi:hypothetical protein
MRRKTGNRKRVGRGKVGDVIDRSTEAPLDDMYIVVIIQNLFNDGNIL